MQIDNARIDFERVLAIVDKVSRYMEFKYGVPFDFSQDKGVQYLTDHLVEYAEVVTSPDLSKEQIDKKVFRHMKDFVRSKSEVFQKVIDEEDGVRKRMWFSPYLNKLVFDEIEELGFISTLADESTEDLKEVFYKHKHLFDLNDKEALFIDLCFSGYNPYNKVDVLVFKEALETDSPKYVLTYFNRLCDRLEKTSLRVGLR